MNSLHIFSINYWALYAIRYILWRRKKEREIKARFSWGRWKSEADSLHRFRSDSEVKVGWNATADWPATIRGDDSPRRLSWGTREDSLGHFLHVVSGECSVGAKEMSRSGGHQQQRPCTQGLIPSSRRRCELEISVPFKEWAPDIQRSDMSQPLGAPLAPELMDQVPEAILLITGPRNTCDFRECRAFLCNIQTCLFQYFFRCWLGLKVTWRN